MSQSHINNVNRWKIRYTVITYYEQYNSTTNKEIYARFKKCTTIETIRLNRLHWFGHVQRMEENRIPKEVLYMNLENKEAER